MSSTDEIGERIRNVLNPYIYPREEASYRKRVLALHLRSAVEDDSVSAPLALGKATQINQPPEARGLHREYLRALEANLEARDQYEKLRKHPQPSHKTQGSGTKGSHTSPSPDPLKEHLVKIKVQRKQAKLEALSKHIDFLNQKELAAAGLAGAEGIFKDTRPLPNVPVDVVSSLALGGDCGQPRLKELIDRLEKQVFRAKMLLKGEAQLLDSVKSRATTRPAGTSDYAKLTALNATRTELIDWMETELGKASPDTGEIGEEDGHNREEEPSTKVDYVDEQLAVIKEKYTQYLIARKSLLELVARKPQPTIAPAASTSTGTRNLESLLSIAHEQKGLINLKSYLNTIINKQLKESTQILDHLAEESHLLPSYPMPGASRRKLGPGFDDLRGTSAEDRNLTTKVKPWVYAADSAKIATLEAVTEKIEEGQVALETSVRTLQEIDQLLGRAPQETEAEGTEEMAEDDMWLAETRSGQTGAARKHARTASKVDRDTDLWSFLDGNLGLLKASE
ncbi:hypothetical protein DL546_006276 [Coniochaeta pulveracea]|uniref:Uncharacterized protein n=1 Tax=Coniochaeta pulveracea TaxID=177199 RepID=A0A420Y4G5_9PEZI|nr:hypothetical protein DL546_006276 [Coniochaeta pulveracea]